MRRRKLTAGLKGTYLALVLAFLFLHEQFTVKSFVGCVLIAAGTLVMVL